MKSACWLLAAAVLALGACENKAQPPAKRTNAVAASASKDSASAKPKPTASSTKAAAAPKEPRDPCKGQEERDPPGELNLARAVGGADKPGKLSYGKGRWTWVNVWAAWCEPCKKEMPMLLEWRAKLNEQGAKLDLVFVSIDDDEREMNRFLESQPKKGVRATYWLKGEEAQEEWFETVGYDDTPTLPIHAFVSPDGKTRCVVDGAMEEGDYAALAKLVGASG